MSNSKKSNVSNPFSVRVDWKETPTAHVFKGDFPGMKKADVKMMAVVAGGIFLQISGERPKEEEDDNKTDKWRMVERARGKFIRRFRLPDDVYLEEYTTSLKDVVLTITVPKRPVVDPHKLEDLANPAEFDVNSYLAKLSQLS